MQGTNEYEALRVAIMKQAIKDYKRALKKRDASGIKTLERFFLSEWGQLLSFGNGELIIETYGKK